MRQTHLQQAINDLTVKVDALLAARQALLDLQKQKPAPRVKRAQKPEAA